MLDLITLAQAGPVAILLVGLVAVVRMVSTGAFVPGWVYKAEREARERAEAREALLLKSIPTLTRIAANGGPAEPGAPSG